MMNETYGYGGMVTIDVGSLKKANMLMEKMQEKNLGYLAVSLGFHKTLFCAPGSSTSSEISDEEQKKMHDEQASERKQQVGSGDRSERIRTYNFPQERVTDHRIGLTLHKLTAIMEGALDEVIDALTLYFQSEALKGNI